VHDIFARLPADLRARCACVCRAWRAAVAERSLWTRLDVSRGTSGVTCRVDDAMLRAVTARAGGRLQALDVSDQAPTINFDAEGTRLLSEDALLAVVAANADTLRELAMRDVTRWSFLEALARRAPQLRMFDVGVYGDCRDVCRVLRGEPPFSVLRVHQAEAYHDGDEEDADHEPQGTHELLAAVASHAALTELHLSWFPLDAHAELDAVIAAALSCRLQHLTFGSCHVAAASAPALARLLGSSTLTTLKVYNEGEQEHHAVCLDAPGAALLAAALRANSTLTELLFASVGMWRDATVAADAETLLAALPAHPSLRVLNLSGNHCTPATVHIAGAALGALVAANTPALHELSAYECSLGDMGLGPLFAALPRNTHLRTLECYENGMSAAFARDVLLPAVRANTSLCMLKLSVDGDDVIMMLQSTLEALRRCDSAEEAAQLLPWLNTA
jgi:hypothetical protein